MVKRFIKAFQGWAREVRKNFMVNPKAKFVVWKFVPVIILLLATKKLQSWLPLPSEIIQNPFIVIDFEFIVIVVLSSVIFVIIADLFWQVIQELAGYSNQQRFIICNWIINKIRIHPIVIWIKLNRK